MGGLQQLLWRSTKLRARSSASSGSIRLLSNTPGFRAHAPTTYSVSRTVLDIDAANNEYVKPFSIHRTMRKTDNYEHVTPLSLVQRSAQPPKSLPHPENKPADVFSEEHALWMNNNAAYYKEYFVREGDFHSRAAFMRMLDITVAHLDRTGTPFSPAFTALGFRRASMFPNGKNGWYLKNVGRYFEEVRTRKWEFEVTQIPHNGNIELSLVSEVDGVKHQWLVTRDLAGIRPLLCLSTGARSIRDGLEPPPIACVRDLVTNREQYMKYLDMVRTMRGSMRGQFKNEWSQEGENGYLKQPPFEVAVQFVSSFAVDSPATAAEVVEKWIASKNSSVAEFKRRVNDEFQDYLIEGHDGNGQKRHAAQEKTKINIMIDEVETKPSQGFDQQTLAMWEKGVRDKVRAAAREIHMTFMAADTAANGLKIRRYIPRKTQNGPGKDGVAEERPAK